MVRRGGAAGKTWPAAGGFAPAIVAVTSAQPAPHAASTTRRHSFGCRTLEGDVACTGGTGVEWDLKTAGEGEQHEVEERAQGMFRPAAPSPSWSVDPAFGSTGWIVRPAPLHSLPSRVLGDGRRL